MAIRPSFRARSDGTIVVSLPSWIRTLLLELFGELERLFAADAASAPVDPLEEITGLRPERTSLPENPVLARLRPEGYSADVEGGQAAADFRRFTEADLAALQRQRVATVREALRDRDRFELTSASAQDWLGALNDLRLALGTALALPEGEYVPPDDSQAEAYQMYQLLTDLQVRLLGALGAPDEF